MTAPIRLLAVHQGGGIGGAPVSLLKLLAALDPTEFEAHAVFTESGDVLDYARAVGVSADVVPTGGAFFYSAHARLGVRSISRFIRTFPRAVHLARRALRQNRPDLVHLNTSVLLAWAAAARRERLPLVWVVREVLGPNRWLRAWHAGFIARHARRIVAISDSVAACLPRSARVDRVDNAVDLGDFRLDLLAERPAIRSELSIAPEAQVVMVVGSVQHPKGHWLILDALPAFPPQAELVLVTGGVDAHTYAHQPRGRVKRALRLPLDNLDAFMRDARHRGLADRITVTGFQRDVARAIAASDVLVFPSLEPEGFGRPIIEAMALERPVVATDVGPSRDLLGLGTGRLVPPEPTALANAVVDLLDSPDTRQRMGRAGRARVEACFSLERQVAQMSAVYRQALERKRV
ncbi:MAG: glycosyltransferase family 4 protein [Chloroflexi bacterium]|nr:glycosyltransferase family 4 protein [Chloroflexota bacterium]